MWNNFETSWTKKYPLREEHGNLQEGDEIKVDLGRSAESSTLRRALERGHREGNGDSDSFPFSKANGQVLETFG